MYVSFYYAYMPTVNHVRPVFLLFNSQCENSREKALCSFPEANLSLSTGERILMRGQRYRVFLDLEMPHSPVNERLGMFMVKVTFLSDSGKVLASSERSGMLHYQSALLQSFTTLFYSLPMVLGVTEEKQTVQINLFEEYMEDSYHPAVGANVVVLAKEIEIYSAALRIEAHFVGLRYIMKNWPVTSALVAVTINFLIISSVFFFAYSAFSPEEFFEEEVEDTQPSDLDTMTAEQQRVFTRRGVGRRESGTENADSTGRQPSTGRLASRMPSASRNQVHSQSNGGMTRCASFPSCRWDMSFQGAAASSACHSSSSLHKHGPRYHSNDDLAGCRGCSYPDGVVGGRGGFGRHPMGFQDLPSSTGPRIDRDPYYVLSFHDGRVWRSRRRPYVDGHDGGEGGDVIPVASYGSERRSPGARAGGLRSRFTWKKVPEHGEMSTESSTECVHTRAANRRRRRARTLSFHKSSDSDEAFGGVRDLDYRCDHSHDCMEFDESTSNAPLKSRVPDGAASSSEHLHHWAPGTVSTVNSGPISADQSPTRTLSDSDHSAAGHKRSVHKTRARFGLSFKKILSKRDDKSS